MILYTCDLRDFLIEYGLGIIVHGVRKPIRRKKNFFIKKNMIFESLRYSHWNGKRGTKYETNDKN